MAAPAVVKVVITVVTDKKLRKIVVGIILGIIVIIVAPIAILLSIGDVGSSMDWSSPEMQEYLVENMDDEEKERLQHFADVMQNIEDEITAQGLHTEPIKAQVIFLSTLIDREGTDTLYSDFISCFKDAENDEEIFANLADKFGVNLPTEEKEKVLMMVEKAVESQTVPPNSTHDEIGELLTGDTSPVSAEYFSSPFRELDWKACLTSSYGRRKDPFTGEESKHCGMDLAAAGGTSLYPSKPGTVLFVRYAENGYGHFVVINHGGSQATLYAHCSAILVAEGDEVTTDTVIAQVGSTGKSTGNHVHFEIIIDGKPVNPKRYLEVDTP